MKRRSSAPAPWQNQTYELWFKQIITEIDSILNIFKSDRVDERLMDLIVSRLRRVIEIQKLLIDQVGVMETMTPLEFLEFRDLLIPASGFQSLQFRTLETKLGLKRDQRLKYNAADFDLSLKPEQRPEIASIEAEPGLFDRVDHARRTRPGDRDRSACRWPARS